MSRKYGGGGTKCVICNKTAFGGEQIKFEKQIYHIDCFRCTTCNRKMGAHEAQLHEGKQYDRRCYQKAGFAHKTQKVVWKKSTTTTTTTSGSGKFGGGGVKCSICTKTVYPAEKTIFEKVIYHNHCFRCSACNHKITTSDCIKHEEKIYCRKCAKTQGITRKQLSSTKTWKKSSGGGGGSSKFGGGGASCEICKATVYGAEKVQYDKKIYHPKCLKCSKCSKVLNPNQADTYEGANFCHKCFAEGNYAQKQAKVKWKKGQSSGGGSGKYGGGGVKCYNCQKTVYAGEKLNFEKHVYHQACFKCDVCKKKMSTSTANHFLLDNADHAKKLTVEWEEKDGAKHLAICKKCFGEKQVRTMQASQKQWTKKDTSESGSKDTRFKGFGGGGSKCKVCSKTVYPAETISFEKNPYHVNCFTCQECNKKLNIGNAHYSKHGGDIDIYCEKCFYAKGLNRARVEPTEEPTETPTEETEETTEENQEEKARDTLD